MLECAIYQSANKPSGSQKQNVDQIVSDIFGHWCQSTGKQALKSETSRPSHVFFEFACAVTYVLSP